MSLDLQATPKALGHIGHPFSEEAVHWALSHRAEVTPALLDSLRETLAQTMERKDTWFRNVFAM